MAGIQLRGLVKHYGKGPNTVPVLHGIDATVNSTCDGGTWTTTPVLATRSIAFTGFAWNPLGMAALGGFERPGLCVPPKGECAARRLRKQLYHWQS